MELGGDLAVGVAAHGLLQHGALAIGEDVRPGRVGRRTGGPVLTDQRGDALVVDIRLALVQALDGLQNLVIGDGFLDIAQPARLQEWHEVQRFAVHGQRQDLGVRPRRADRLRRLDAVHVGQGDVHQDDVRAKLERQGDGPCAIGGLPDNLRPVRCQQHAQAAAHDGVIIHQQNTYALDHSGTSSNGI